MKLDLGINHLKEVEDKLQDLLVENNLNYEVVCTMMADYIIRQGLKKDFLRHLAEVSKFAKCRRKLQEDQAS